MDIQFVDRSKIRKSRKITTEFKPIIDQIHHVDDQKNIKTNLGSEREAINLRSVIRNHFGKKYKVIQRKQEDGSYDVYVQKRTNSNQKK